MIWWFFYLGSLCYKSTRRNDKLLLGEVYIVSQSFFTSTILTTSLCPCLSLSLSLLMSLSPYLTSSSSLPLSSSFYLSDSLTSFLSPLLSSFFSLSLPHSLALSLFFFFSLSLLHCFSLSSSTCLFTLLLFPNFFFGDRCENFFRQQWRKKISIVPRLSRTKDGSSDQSRTDHRRHRALQRFDGTAINL